MVKWTQLDRFQRTRGVLRTFALALREAEKWDESPLIRVPAVFCFPLPKLKGLLSTPRTCSVADTEEYSREKTSMDRWCSILNFALHKKSNATHWLKNAKLSKRSCNISPFTTIDQKAKTRDLYLLIGQYAPRHNWINKAMIAWAQTLLALMIQIRTFPQVPPSFMRGVWENKPNLNQMHSNKNGI